MKLDKTITFLNSSKTIGLVIIKDLGNAQQVWVDLRTLKKALKLLDSLTQMNFEKICITVEKDQPLIIGGNKIGIAISPVVGD